MKKPDDNEDTKDKSKAIIQLPVNLMANPKSLKMTVKKKKEILQNLANEYNITKAAAKVGINRSTFYEVYNTDPTFKKAVDMVDDAWVDANESVLLKFGAEGKNIAANIWVTKTRRKEKYHEKLDINFNTQITIESDSQVRAILQRILPYRHDEITDASYKDVSNKEKKDESSKRNREKPNRDNTDCTE